MMRFIVWNAQGDVLYQGESWPMARAALDYAIAKNEGCPVLNIEPRPNPEPTA